MKMTYLVACVGTGKGTWSEVSKLISSESWTGIFIITNDFGKENFAKKFPDIKAEFVVVDDFAQPQQLVEYLNKVLTGKIKDSEVAVNMVSGTGTVHMALVSAIIKLGLAIRFVVSSESGAKEL
jgi:hypothetical protein